MKVTFIMSLFCLSFSLLAQDINNFEQIDKYKIAGLIVEVYFKDPLKEIKNKFPDFDKKENQKKHDILSGYLHNNSLYIFQTYKKDKLIKTYVLTGNPKKIKDRNYFNLDIYNNNILEKSIDKVNVGGSFFEHMFIFQTAESKKYIGNGVKIWGYFVMIQPYSDVKKVITDLIKMDISNTLPVDFLSKSTPFIEPLFDYQKWGLEKIKERIFNITVYQYDALGQVTNRFPRVENDTSLYISSTSQDLGSVTTFPYFSQTDTLRKEGQYIFVKSRLENINHYLKDIRITVDSITGQVRKIDGKLIIHGYTMKGHTTFDEIYIADFEKIEDCYLPKVVKFYPIDDKELARPRVITEINYKLK